MSKIKTSLLLKNIYFYFVHLILVVNLLVLFCSVSISVATENIVKIGLSLGLTGKYQKMAIIQKNGYTLWETSINKKGGLLGKNVKLQILDDKSNPDKAKIIYRQMAESKSFDFLFAPFSSEITEAILPVTEKYGFSLLAAGASADRLWKQGYKNVFGLFTPASKIAVSFLEMAALNHLKSVAIVYADNSFSKDIAQGCKLWSDRFGLHTVYYEKLPENKEKLIYNAQDLKTLQPDIVVIGGHLEEAVAMRQALTDIDWQPQAFYAPQGPAIPSFYQKLGPAANGVFSTSQWERLGGIHQPGIDGFINDYKLTFNTEPQYFAATAYAAGQILEAVINKTKSLDRSKISLELSRLNFESIIGRYGVNQKGVQVKNFTLVVQVQKDGKREVVWPRSLMTKNPIFN